MEWLKSADVATFLGVDAEVVRSLVRRKHLKCYKLPGIKGYRFLQSDLDKYVSSGLIDVIGVEIEEKEAGGNLPPNK